MKNISISTTVAIEHEGIGYQASVTATVSIERGGCDADGHREEMLTSVDGIEIEEVLDQDGNELKRIPAEIENKIEQAVNDKTDWDEHITDDGPDYDPSDDQNER